MTSVPVSFPVAKEDEPTIFRKASPEFAQHAVRTGEDDADPSLLILRFCKR